MASDLLAQLDEFRAALRDIAQTLRVYREQLIDAGFTPDDALELCLDVQRAVIFDGMPNLPTLDR